MQLAPLDDRSLAALLKFLADRDNFAFFETTRTSPGSRHSYLFLDSAERLTCAADDDPLDFLRQAEARLKAGYYLAGWLSFEFGYLLEPHLASLVRSRVAGPLAILEVYRQPHIYDHGTASFSGAGPWPGREADGRQEAYQLSDVCLNLGKDEYLNAIDRIKSYIESGDTYQVNYTLKYHFNFNGSVEELYRTLRRNQSVAYSAYIKQPEGAILSFSPELFFSRHGRECLVRPMKGTLRRGRTPAEDLDLAHFLRDDEKNRSENVMIVDLLRNDLGRLCEMGSVRTRSLFDIERFETLHQMTSSIEGRLRPEITLADFFGALFPSGSVTGAPKIRTMEIIHELEMEKRGVYTGGIGFLGPDGSAVFNVPIRTLVLRGHRGEMGIGSGIVYDSDGEREWEECLLKGSFLTRPMAAFQLIETLLWEPEGGYWLLAEHLDRLLGSAVYFGFQADRDKIGLSLEKEAGSFAAGSCQRVRLALHKDGRLTITATPSVPPMARDFAHCGPAADLPAIILSASPTDDASPFLYHKTTNRGLYDAERERAVAAGFFEVVFANRRGELTEGAITNLFVRKAGRLLTPRLDCGLLNGVLRRHLLAAAGPERVEEAVLTVDDLRQAEAIYVGNSVRGLVQVRL